MTKDLKTIVFTVIENVCKQQITTHYGKYPNLMYLLKQELDLDGAEITILEI